MIIHHLFYCLIVELLYLLCEVICGYVTDSRQIVMQYRDTPYFIYDAQCKRYLVNYTKPARVDISIFWTWMVLSLVHWCLMYLVNYTLFHLVTIKFVLVTSLCHLVTNFNYHHFLQIHKIKTQKKAKPYKTVAEKLAEMKKKKAMDRKVISKEKGGNHLVY